MKPAARIQAAIELLDAIICAARAKGAPADRLIADYFRQRRYAGSKDRRGVRELVYRAIRLCGPVPLSGRAAMLAVVQTEPEMATLFDGSEHGPAPIGERESVAKTGAVPRWLADRLAASDLEKQEQAALLSRAPLDVRVNALKAERASIDLPETGEALSAPHALRFPAGTPVEGWQAYRDGLVEIQDHGSQWVCEALGAQPGETILDLCAGAGGKTLAIAAATGDRATIIAADTDKRRLGNLAPRAERAGATIAQTVLLDPGREREALKPWLGMVDRVLVDAPCSGSGTWRRNPESRWRLDPPELKRLITLQDHVLDIAADALRPGGVLGFVVCSLLDAEGPERIAAFIARHPGFEAIAATLPIGRPRGAGTRFTPYHDDTDGFFIAMLRAP
ncbi:MAG: RsmB/NOP family class I SAM-dependent RNA methyltransferase [Erythrobacter sp.]